MPSDITWNQLKTDLAASDAIALSGTDIIIKVGSITGDTYASLDSMGVVEFAQKLLAACNKTQTRINQGVEVGSRLAAFPNSSLGTPTKDSDGFFRVTSTQQIISRLTVDANSVVGLTN